MYVTMCKYQNIKICLQKSTLQIRLTKFFLLKNVKNTFPWTNVISDLNGEEIFRAFNKNELQKTNQKEFRFEK